MYPARYFPAIAVLVSCLLAGSGLLAQTQPGQQNNSQNNNQNNPQPGAPQNPDGMAPLYTPSPASLGGGGGGGDEGQSSAAPVRISGGVMAGMVLNRVPPVYPPDAKAAGLQGAVVLLAEIDTNGAVARLRAVSGPDVLRKAALEAVRQWTYRPYLLNGRPTRVQTTITVHFQLADGGAEPQP